MDQNEKVEQLIKMVEALQDEVQKLKDKVAKLESNATLEGAFKGLERKGVKF